MREGRPMDSTEQAAMRKAADFLHQLYCRWLDEHEYEDFSEYQQVMKSNLPTGAQFVKMTKRPFEVQFDLNGVRKYIKATTAKCVWGSKVRKVAS
jgi:hypothetical protein